MHSLEATPPLPLPLFGGHPIDPACGFHSRAATLRGSGPVDLPADLTPQDCLQAMRELGDWTAAARFSSVGYQRTLIYCDDARAIYVMGWLPGQFSTIHDHGEAPCAYGVLRGCLQEQVFRFHEPTGPRELLPELLNEYAWPAGAHLGHPADIVHRCGNAPGSRSPLVTLHVYASPARPARTYEVR